MTSASARPLVLAFLSLATGALALGACGGGSGAGLGPADAGGSLLSADGGCTVNDQNTYARCYPTANIGTQHRRGTLPGNVIQNFRFTGYRNSDLSTPVTGVRLADYYDPEQRQYKIIHLSVAGAWCDPCKLEAQAMVAVAPQLVQEGIVFVTALSDNAGMGPANLADLEQWITTYKPTFTMVLDPAEKNLGIFFDTSQLPWNANIDARTMEILTSDVAAPTKYDVKGDAEAQLQWVNTHPPSY
jgi:hypothetical protein